MPTDKRAIHYAGDVRTATTTILAGWATCASGEQAEEIRRQGAHTYTPGDVTCKRCVRVMLKAREYHKAQRCARCGLARGFHGPVLAEAGDPQCDGFVEAA